jgi:hypothetical protein
MSSDETRQPRRHIRAAIAGAISGILLAVIAIVMIRPGVLWEYDYTVSGESAPPSLDPNHYWHVCCAVTENLAIGGPLLLIVGASIGLAGSARRMTFRATAVGSVVLSLFAWTGPLVYRLTPQLTHEFFGEVWMLPIGLSVFSICSFSGALAAGKTSNDGRSHVQFSLGELLFVFVPFVIFMGSLEQFARK